MANFLDNFRDLAARAGLDASAVAQMNVTDILKAAAALPNNFPPSQAIETHTADATLSAASRGKLITNRGAAGAVVLTLPVSPTIGDVYEFLNEAAQEFQVQAGAGGTITDTDGNAIGSTAGQSWTKVWCTAANTWDFVNGGFTNGG